jgi:hypothetical protein
MMTIRATTWLVGIVLLAAVFLLAVHLSANNMEFSRSNIGWNGTSSFFSDLNRHHTVDIIDPGQLAGYPPNTTLLIIAPYRHPTAEELAAYSAFLKKGDTIFLADDFGTGNEILSGIGSHVSLLPGNLSSLDRRYPDSYSVIAYRAVDEEPFSLPSDIALNRPAALDGGSPLMLTSIMSWIDLNGEHRLTRGEELGTYPVMVTESIGTGQLIVLSDPSIFINSMYSQPENGNNRDLIRNIVTLNNQVLIDQQNSRTAGASGFSEILQVIGNTSTIEIFIICLLMLGTALAWRKKII